MTQEPKYPGLPTTTDGSGSIVWVESHVTDGSCAYPITSSTNMGVGYNTEVANGKKNLWGTQLVFIEPESEHSSASAMEGFALAGGRVTNFTSGQGLILMKEVLYVISGKRLPIVLHVGARALTSHSLNVHAGHDDVMGAADVGWGMLFARNAQEAADLALICRRVAEDTDTPFMNVQDGFLTTHTLEVVNLPEPEFMKEYVGDPADKLRNMMDPDFPIMSGVVQNQESYMKGKIAQRYFTDKILPTLEEAMEEFTIATGREYKPVIDYRMEDAEYAVIGMGTMVETAQAVVDSLREEGKKVGAVHMTAFRPFPAKQLLEVIKNCKAVACLERMDDPLSESNPLTLEVKSAVADAMQGRTGFPKLDKMPIIHSGAYGLGSRDVTSSDILAVYDLLESDAEPDFFSLHVDHPTGLTKGKPVDGRPKGSFSLRGHSVGGFGSVTTNKVIATISADLFGKEIQAFPLYGSEKKGLPTNFYLTIADEKVKIHHELDHLDFIAIQDVNAFNMGNPLNGLNDGGTVFVQSVHEDPKDVLFSLPIKTQKEVKERNIRVLYIDTAKIGREVASSPDLVVRMQGIVLLGIFLKATPFAQKFSEEELFVGARKSLSKYFGKRGEKVVEENLTCVKRGFSEVHEIPVSIIEEVVE